MSSTQRERLWSHFELTTMWREFLSSIGVDPKFYTDPILIQVIARCLFEKLLKLVLQTASPTVSSPPHITTDETNAIRYVGGYILKKIRNKYKSTKSNEILIQFIETLHPNEDENGGDIAETFLEYTTRWINKANRGGLFKIADNVYQTYYAMEVVLRTFLKDCIVNVPKLQQEVIEDSDVQFWWALVSSELDDDLAQVLLFDMVKLWITFAYTSSIVDQYKQCKKATLQRKRALRKDLKASNNELLF